MFISWIIEQKETNLKRFMKSLNVFAAKKKDLCSD